MIFGADSIADGIIVWVGGSLIAAFLIAVIVFIVRRPGRWVWRTLVTDPLGGWFDKVVTNAVENSPTAKQVDHIADQIRPTNGDRRSISDRLDTVKYRVGTLEEKHDELAEKVATIGANNPSRGLVDDHLNEQGEHK